MADYSRKTLRERQTGYVPADVVEGILPELPAKSLLRFKSVSKQFDSLITSSDFIDRHVSNQRTTKDPQFLLLSSNSSLTRKIVIFKRVLNSNELTINSNGISTINDLPKDWYDISSSFDGIFCFSGFLNIIVYNLSTTEFRILPRSETLKLGNLTKRPTKKGRLYNPNQQLGIGRDLVTKQYKIVKVFNPVDDRRQARECEIFTLDPNPNASWKVLGVVPYKIDTTATHVYVNGSMYWFTDKKFHGNENEVIVMFDLHMEKFQAIPHPSCCSDPDKPRKTMQLGSLRDSLCLTERIDWKEVNIWIMITCKSNVVTWEKLHYLRLIMTIHHEILTFGIAKHKDGTVLVCGGDGGGFVATRFCPLVPLYGQRLPFRIKTP
ncbi:hypothetical protein CCACVL1_27286 [Corchorus capsularis]|uniref:F-box domain-containing protein n=1 Tax=Corchorus capsularis TaxID=210143 RepID=A0A1R3GBA9_COCAP|nr:hypothetical protein CCACVL1_27286 [Corchorus capsularis]